MAPLPPLSPQTTKRKTAQSLLDAVTQFGGVAEATMATSRASVCVGEGPAGQLSHYA